MTEKDNFTLDNPIMFDKKNGRCRCIPIPYEKDMAEKRFENRLDKSNVKFNTLNPVWDNEKEDALNVFKMVDLLNELGSENKKLEKENIDLSEELDYYKAKCASLETGLFQADKENKQLKQNCKNYNWYKEYKKLLNENEQLKADKQSLIDFIRKEFPKSYKHILEGL